MNKLNDKSVELINDFVEKHARPAIFKTEDGKGLIAFVHEDPREPVRMPIECSQKDFIEFLNKLRVEIITETNRRVKEYEQQTNNQ